MSGARDQILKAVRNARAGKPSMTALASGRQALLPPQFVREARELEALFLARLEAVSATHSSVVDLAKLPAHLAGWLATRKLPAEFVLAREPRLVALDWTSGALRPELREPGLLTPATIVSCAFAGVAETGSIALLTRGPSRPAHNLMAGCHVVILDRRRIMPAIEDVWRAAIANGQPRGVALITGPSRTADIEMSMELGVHGAVHLHVILAGGATTGG